MEISYIKQPWVASQPKQSSELLLEELKHIGGGGDGGGGSVSGASGIVRGGNIGSVIVTGNSMSGRNNISGVKSNVSEVVGNVTSGDSANMTTAGRNTTRRVLLANIAPTIDKSTYFDLIIHHVASYPYPLQKTIFESLWGTRLNHGGLYVMEGLETTHNGEHAHIQGGLSMIREIVAWAGSLLYNGRIAGG